MLVVVAQGEKKLKKKKKDKRNNEENYSSTWDYLVRCHTHITNNSTHHTVLFLLSFRPWKRFRRRLVYVRTFIDSAQAATESCARSSNTPMSTARYTLLRTCSVDRRGGYHVVYAGAAAAVGDPTNGRPSPPPCPFAARRSIPG